MRSRTVIGAEGAYYLLTGVAPFASRSAFEAVTGPKREWWLVQTVGSIVAVVGAGLLAAATRDRVTAELVTIGAGCAVGLATIDVVYVARRRIKPTYLLDAAAQAAVLWGLASARDDHE